MIFNIINKINVIRFIQIRVKKDLKNLIFKFNLNDNIIINAFKTNDKMNCVFILIKIQFK